MALSDRLNGLGWKGVPRLTAFTNIMLLYLAAGLDTSVPRRLIGVRSDRNGDTARRICERTLIEMLDRAQEARKLELLRRPCVREPSEALAIIEQLYADE